MFIGVSLRLAGLDCPYLDTIMGPAGQDVKGFLRGVLLFFFMTVATIDPAEMSPEGSLDSTLIRRLDDIADRISRTPPPAHPVKDIVIPLTVVMALLGNALMIGIAWGRFSQRMDGYDDAQQKLDQRVTAGATASQDLKDRMRDAERDIKEMERRFMLFDDYTRGRIDRLPYKSPPPARW